VGAALRILVVDDSDMVRNGIRDILVSSSEKWTICGELADGEELIARASECKPDVLLLDLSVTRVSGLGVINTLREALPGMAIMIMSEQEPSVLRHLAESFGVEYYLSKSRLATDLLPQLEAISRAGKPE
jgi:two-component system, NarL family, response regulator NreC